MGKPKSQRSRLGRSRPARRLLAAGKKLSRKSGLPPGTVVHVGDEPATKGRVSLTQYSETHLQESRNPSAVELANLPEREDCLWISVEGLGQLDLVEAIGKRFRLHPLVIEDLVNTSQRPKLEDSGDYLFFVLKLLRFQVDTTEIESEQMSFVLGRNYLLTFRESQGTEFDAVRDRLNSGAGRVRKSGTDYLAYCLVDTIVDNYFVILEQLAERIEVLEEELVTNPTETTLEVIHRLKTDMIFLRRSVWPLREIVNSLSMSDSGLIKDSTAPYWRDVYDHTIHAIDTMETYRDIMSGMVDIYLSGISNKLNEIMKVLTLIATIFIPLTFMTGWYGMNFKHMPELDWQWGYPVFVMLASCVAFTMLLFFKRKNWI